MKYNNIKGIYIIYIRILQMSDTIQSVVNENVIENVHIVPKKMKQSRKAKNVIQSGDVLFDEKEFFDRKNDLSEYKLVQLKSIAKSALLSQSGNKTAIISRIQHHFYCIRSARIIQKVVRGMFVRFVLSRLLRGKAFIERGLCINESDVCTLEPLNEIPFQQFISITESSGITYGYDINTLIMLSRKRSTFIGPNIIYNPYNRIPFEKDVSSNINILYNLLGIVFPDCILLEDREQLRSPLRRQQNRRQRRTGVHARRILEIPPTIISRYMSTSISFITAGCDPTVVMSTRVQLIQKAQLLRATRDKPTSMRMSEIFMEIDLLGNYTDSEWMRSLSIVQLQRFYRSMMNIWRYRARLGYDTKRKICPAEEPFTASSPVIDTNELDETRRMCLYAMELMVFSALDIELRKIGAMHVLTALTMVSLNARERLPWLYESMNY